MHICYFVWIFYIFKKFWYLFHWSGTVYGSGGYDILYGFGPEFLNKSSESGVFKLKYAICISRCYKFKGFNILIIKTKVSKRVTIIRIERS